MDSAKAISDIPLGFKLSRQAILARNETLWGSEIRAHVNFQPNSKLGDIHQSLKSAYHEALHRTKLNACLLKRSVQACAHPGSHKLFCLEQFALADENILEEIVNTCETLSTYNQQFIIGIENNLSTLAGPAERREMIQKLYRLKDCSNIKLCYNNYTNETNQTNLLIDLGLYDYIKMPFPDSTLRLSINARSDLLDRLYDKMSGLINSMKASFIVGNIEHSESAILAKRFPFDYFQGDYFSPSENT